MKPFKHNELSNVRCKQCKKRLKMNLIFKNPKAELCYKCKKKIEYAEKKAKAERKKILAK